MMTETMADRFQRMKYADLGGLALGLQRLDPNCKIKETDYGVTLCFSDGSSYRTPDNQENEAMTIAYYHRIRRIVV